MTEKIINELNQLYKNLSQGGYGWQFDICRLAKEASEELERLDNFVQSQCAKQLEENRRLKAKLEQYRQADQEGRLIILGEKTLPMIWGDAEKNTILCPNCERDLMGGYPDDSLEDTIMWQCRYCGQPVNPYEAVSREEAEAALAKEGVK